ncbi:MAG: type II toxin-antitoxin system RelE/ParE family toxin [Spirochaetes bacterium]|nr:type II toxin-antitoxin system RelE/ParE family toxin [Spirochaetota bacterium]
MQVVLYSSFEKTVKKLHVNEKKDLDKAVKTIIENPHAGDLKKGDLHGIRVFKFKMKNQLTLLAYRHNETKKIFEVLALGSHENFYRDLKT